MFKALCVGDAIIYHSEAAAECVADMLNATEDEEGIFYTPHSVMGGPFVVKALDKDENFLFYVGD